MFKRDTQKARDRLRTYGRKRERRNRKELIILDEKHLRRFFSVMNIPPFGEVGSFATQYP